MVGIGKDISKKEFPGIGGFSVGNLWLMAQFYNEYQTNWENTLPDVTKKNATLAIKDHYTFQFLNLSDEHGEDVRRFLS